MLRNINAKKLLLLLLLAHVLSCSTIELLEQNSNELLELKEMNSTETNKTIPLAAASNAVLRQYPPQFTGPIGGGGGIGGGFNGLGGGAGGGLNGLGGCPLCDASVYSYCSHKMLHDDCCCNYPVPQLRPPQCYYIDCALLYAKSCYEHSLITNCCCNNPY
ncbi:small cysteine and glycine repeat-containing protein 4 [Anastrepha obliqua]|uniref:small cysteine and glycine repeat-containing protein 4 n=1 Tax=Anastrepha obliqua TaxID=95512 RepID=UPI0024097E62|nr:small cysteine and glycine repeat-containing protein 4 [Anastrepha obliqua]